MEKIYHKMDEDNRSFERKLIEKINEMIDEIVKLKKDIKKLKIYNESLYNNKKNMR